MMTIITERTRSGVCHVIAYGDDVGDATAKNKGETSVAVANALNKLCFGEKLVEDCRYNRKSGFKAGVGMSAILGVFQKSGFAVVERHPAKGMAVYLVFDPDEIENGMAF